MFTAVFKLEFVKFNTYAAIHSMLGKYVTRKEIRLNKVSLLTSSVDVYINFEQMQ